MTHAPGKYADFEGLRERAVALRRSGYSLRQIRDELKIYNNDILNQLVKGEPPPAWTKRPKAKDDLRQKARELRLQGWTYDRIQVELGCSKSSISLWVRDLPKRPNPKTRRKNVGDSYRGCLVIKVLKGADLYRRIEGSWYGIVESAREADLPNRT
jgi:hypothetical protein